MANDAKESKWQAKETIRVARIKREGSTEVRVNVNVFDDRVLADVRVFYKKKGEKNALPSGKGLSFSLDELLDLRKALRKAERIIEERTEEE